MTDMEEHFPSESWSWDSVILLDDINIALYPTHARLQLDMEIFLQGSNLL